MKRLTALLITALLAVILAGCVSTAVEGDSEELVVVGYGAEYQEIFQRVIAEPFKQQTGITIKYSSGGSASEYYAQVRASRGEPGFDVAVGTYLELFQGKRDGLLAPVTEEEVPNLKNAPALLREQTQGVGIIQEVQYLSLMYNKSRFATPPTNWDVMWDPQYRSGALIFNPSNFVGVLQILATAEASGGGIDNVDPGFARLAELAPFAAGTPTASAEAIPFMERGLATAFPYLDGRAAIYAATTDYDYTIPETGALASLGSLSIPSGASNKEGAYRLMDFWLQPEVQKAWSEAYQVGPGIEGLTFPAEFTAKHITTAEQLAKLTIADAAAVIESRSDWAQRWAESVR